MPQDPLPGKLVLYGRDANRDRWLRDYLFRNPSADTGEGTDLWIEASSYADGVAPLYQDAATIANGVSRATATGPELDAWAVRMGTVRSPPTGASGALLVTASAGGTFIQSGDEVTYQGKRYHATQSGLFTDQAQVPVIGTDTGPSTNLPPGAVLTWSAPRPGCAPTAVVVQQADGTGLSGGRLVESDGELRARLDYIAANPPASGNDAAYQLAVMQTPGVSVQAPFTFPAIKGPGTIGICFTLRPLVSGGNRFPNSVHIAAVLANVKDQMPADDGIFVFPILANPINVNLRVSWTQGAAGWVDAQPWPPYVSPAVSVPLGAASATSFSIAGAGGSVPDPSVGQSIAFFDSANLVFRKKKILTVAVVGGTWNLTVDTTNGASDTSFVPYAGLVPCPWSDSLGDVVPLIVSYFDTLGPGEQVASPFDPGLRQRRSPPNPQFWPSSITNRLISQVFDLPSVLDVVLADPAVPYAAPLGHPAIDVYMNTLLSLAIFPQ